MYNALIHDGYSFSNLCNSYPVFILKAEVEVERLDQLKASRMKEIAFKKQAELEEIFAHAHIEVDPEAARERIMEVINSGTVEPAELLADMDNRITKAKEEALSRKEILDRVEKWMSACEEESWLEDYNRVLVIALSNSSYASKISPCLDVTCPCDGKIETALVGRYYNPASRL